MYFSLSFLLSIQPIFTTQVLESERRSWGSSSTHDRHILPSGNFCMASQSMKVNQGINKVSSSSDKDYGNIEQGMSEEDELGERILCKAREDLTWAAKALRRSISGQWEASAKALWSELPQHRKTSVTVQGKVESGGEFPEFKWHGKSRGWFE